MTATHRLTVYPGTDDGELFDLQNDPDDCFNLWYAPESAELKANLIVQLLHEYGRHTPFHPIPPGSA
ncbi:MAG: hypothetical protein O2923_00805 [Verrucomicrobia bacterium]|nr:hypothetical protein [Verrucomicrobiota bacterium]MDA1085977.1 hypothetical protein [Verrucomicrobiota bacterium]